MANIKTENIFIGITAVISILIIVAAGIYMLDETQETIQPAVSLPLEMSGEVAKDFEVNSKIIPELNDNRPPQLYFHIKETRFPLLLSDILKMSHDELIELSAAMTLVQNIKDIGISVAIMNKLMPEWWLQQTDFPVEYIEADYK